MEAQPASGGTVDRRGLPPEAEWVLEILDTYLETHLGEGGDNKKLLKPLADGISHGRITTMLFKNHVFVWDPDEHRLKLQGRSKFARASIAIFSMIAPGVVKNDPRCVHIRGLKFEGGIDGPLFISGK